MRPTGVKGRRRHKKKAEERESLNKIAQEKKALALAGQCVYKGEVMTFKEAGRRGGKAEWDNATKEEQEKRKESGRLQYELADDEDKENIAQADSRAWNNAPEAEKERRKESGRIGGPKGWELVGEETRKRIVEEGKVGGRTEWENASSVEKESRKECGRRGGWESVNEEGRRIIAEEGRAGGIAAWENATDAEQEERREIGRTAFDNLCFDEQERVVTAGIHAYENLNEEQLNRINVGQSKGRELMQNRANVRYGTPGVPSIIPNNKVWECTGTVDADGQIPCKFSCLKQVDHSSFFNTPELTFLHYLTNHKLMDTDCNRNNCQGQCRPVALEDTVGLKCTAEGCGAISKGGRRGFRSKGRLPLGKTIAMVHLIVTGCSYKLANTVLGLKISKNTWTRYIKDIGMVAGESLERNRREERNQYTLAQIDETAFGKRVRHFFNYLRWKFVQVRQQLFLYYPQLVSKQKKISWLIIFVEIPPR